MTELGELPEEWEVIPIYELRDKADRYSFTGGPFGSDLKSEHYTSSGIRILQLQDIGEGVFLNKSRIYTTEEKANQLKSCNIFPGEIILAKMAPVARCCKIPATEDRFLMCSDGIRLSIDKERYDNEFVYQALNSPYFRKEAESHSSGTTRARIGLNDLKHIAIAVPSTLAEQQKIAEILSTIDDKIDVIDAQITQTEKLKKGLMQQLLTRGIGHTQLKYSPTGEIPEPWKHGTLGDIAEIIMGQSPPGETYNNEGAGVPILNGPTEFTRTYPIPIQYTTKPVKFSKKGDILFCVRGSSTGRMNISDQVYCIGRGLAAISAKANASTEFIYFLLLSISEEILRKAKDMGSTFPNVNSTDLKNKPIKIPPFDEQGRISTILRTVDEKLEILQEKKASYQQLKKSLMQQLLTGKLRVNHLIEKEVLA